MSLTTSIDLLTGTAGNDTFTGLATTFTSTDTIDGGAGNDTLITVIAGNITPVLTSVENVIFTATAASTINFAGSTGLDTVKSIGSTAPVTISGIATSDAVTIQNTTAAHTLTYASVTGSADAATVAVNNYVSGGATAETTAVAQKITITAIAADASAGTISINVGGVINTVVGGANAGATATIIAANINSMFGSAVAVVPAGATTTVVVTAPTAGTPLPTIGLSASAVGILPTTALTTANVVGVAGVDAGTLTVAGIETLSINSSGAASTVALTSAAASKLNITGSADLTLSSALAAVTTTVDANTFTGALTVNHSANAAVVTFTGGAGADTIVLGATYVGGVTGGTRDIINGGAGRDTLTLTSAVANTSVNQANVTNVEIIRISDAVANNIDLTKFASADTLRVDAAIGAATFTFNSGSNFVVPTGAAGNAARTFVVAGTGTADALTITGVAGTNLGTTEQTFTGIETLNVATGTAGTGDFTFGGAVTMTATAGGTAKIVATGGNSLLLAGAVTASEVDAAGLTGSALLNMTGGSMAGAARITGTGNNDIIIGSAGADVINGGAGNDNITGGGGDDVINGGDGTDTITGGLGADTMTGGAGVDTFAFAKGDTGGANGAAVADVITDFVVGTDKLQFTGVTEVVSAEQAAVQAAVTALAAGSSETAILNAMLTANATDNGVSFATFGGHTYVVLEGAKAGDTFVLAEDVFIKLEGVTTLPLFANDVIA